MTEKFLEVRRAGLPVRHTGAAYPVIDGAPFGEGRQPSVVSQVWDMLWRRKWTVLAGLLSVLTVATLVTWKLPRTFTSTVTVLVGSGPRNAGLTELDLLNQGPAIQTEMKLIGSRRILEPVVDNNDLHVKVVSPAPMRPAEMFPGFEAGRGVVPGTYVMKKLPNGAVEMWKSAPSVAFGLWKTGPDSLVATLRPGLTYAARGLRFQLPGNLPEGVELQVNTLEGAVGGLMTQVTASLVDPDAQIVLISCQAGSPRLSQRICDGVSKSYVIMRNDLARSDASHSAAFLRQQSDTVGVQLAAAEDELRRYKESNDVVDPQTLASMESGELAQFQARRDELEAERAALAGFIDRLGDGSDSEKYRDLAAYPTFINNPMVGNILQNLVTYENQLHELEQRRTDVNPDVVALKQRIGELQGQLGQLARNYESALTGQVASLDQGLGRSRGRLSVVPRKQMDVARLERHAEMLTQLYTTLQQKLKEAQISEAVELADVSIIDPPTFPTQPSFPNVILNLALGLVGGLLLGLAGALLQEFADTRVRRRHEVEQETGLPVLTMIPSVKGGRFIVGRTRNLLKGGPETGGARLRDYYPVGGEVVVEAFRSLGADLGFMSQSLPDRNLRTVVFTSPSRGEGKTFTAVNFAATRALEGYRTLLIDADLRAGAASAAVGLASAPGLSDVLAGQARLLDAIRMVKVGNHRLAVLGAGTVPRDPGTLVTSDELEEVLATASEHFDQVVVDTPPINMVSDAALLAARAHAVIVVVRSGQTDREALDLTLSRLARVGARPLGIVLNDVKLGGGDSEGIAVYEPAQEAAG
jgi:tyrosine-protein kinase Etk/Wzc